MSLQLLSHEDAQCLFIVRRINKLGFKAAKKLKQYFTMFGTVVNVLCAHSTVRLSNGESAPPIVARKRPSSLGFVQMADAYSVSKILEHEHEVDGFLIRVEKFERHQSEAAAEEANEHEQALSCGPAFAKTHLEDRYQSEQSASTEYTAAGRSSSSGSDS